MSQDSIGARLVALIARPGQLMEWVKEKPRWIVPAFIILVCSMVGFGAVAHIAIPESMEMSASAGGADCPSMDFMENLENPSLPVRGGIGLATGLISLVTIFLQAAIWLLFAKLSGGTATFVQVMGVTFWASLTSGAIGQLVKWPLIVAKDSALEVSIGLAALMPNVPFDSTLFKAAYMFGDFFVWWSLALVVIGMKVVNGFTTGKAAVIVLLPWILFSGTCFGFQLITGSLGAG